VRLRVQGTYEFDVDPGAGGHEQYRTAAECIEFEEQFAEETLVGAIHDGLATFSVAEVKGKP
jgi:hypothetical protein